jgi:hypothetical protein
MWCLWLLSFRTVLSSSSTLWHVSVLHSFLFCCNIPFYGSHVLFVCSRIDWHLVWVNFDFYEQNYYEYLLGVLHGHVRIEEWDVQVIWYVWTLGGVARLVCGVPHSSAFSPVMRQPFIPQHPRWHVIICPSQCHHLSGCEEASWSPEWLIWFAFLNK